MRTCKPGTGQKNEMGKTIGNRSANGHDHDHGFAQVVGNDGQESYRRPADDIAQADEPKSHPYPGCQFGAQSGEIRFLFQGLTNETRPRQSGDDSRSDPRPRHHLRSLVLT